MCSTRQWCSFDITVVPVSPTMQQKITSVICSLRFGLPSRVHSVLRFVPGLHHVAAALCDKQTIRTIPVHRFCFAMFYFCHFTPHIWCCQEGIFFFAVVPIFGKDDIICIYFFTNCLTLYQQHDIITTISREGVASAFHAWQVNIPTVSIWLALNCETHV